MALIYRLSLLCLLGVLMTSAAGCGCSDDDDDDDGSGDDATDDDATDDTDDDCGSADLIPGNWTAEMISLDIAEDLSYHAVGATDTGYDVTGTIQIDGCTISFTDLEGSNPCPSAQVGQYSFVVTETSLTTTLVEDACLGRSVGLDGTIFARE